MAEVEVTLSLSIARRSRWAYAAAEQGKALEQWLEELADAAAAGRILSVGAGGAGLPYLGCGGAGGGSQEAFAGGNASGGTSSGPDAGYGNASSLAYPTPDAGYGGANGGSGLSWASVPADELPRTNASVRRCLGTIGED